MNKYFYLTLAPALLLASCMVDLTPLTHERVNFVRKVKPILEGSCLECHQQKYVSGGLSLETRELAMKGGKSGPVIVPGSPNQSLLYKVLLLGHDKPLAMPPTPERLDRDYEQTIHDWIQQGAKWPDGVKLTTPQDLKKPNAELKTPNT